MRKYAWTWLAQYILVIGRAVQSENLLMPSEKPMTPAYQPAPRTAATPYNRGPRDGNAAAICRNLRCNFVRPSSILLLEFLGF